MKKFWKKTPRIYDNRMMLGELNFNDIGRTITITQNDDGIVSTVTGVLDNVTHGEEYVYGSLMQKRTETRVMLKVRPDRYWSTKQPSTYRLDV